MTENIESSKLELQLGDVIQIKNPVNEIVNDQIFIIDYIDTSKIYLINADTLKRIKLTISEDGVLGDGNITNIDILSRADSPSYAIQNGLKSGKWINIYFGGEFPTIITGEITNLENDMIEIKTTDDDVIYINFAYKGIPEDLPIDNIEIREKPKEKPRDEEFPEMIEEKEMKVVNADELQIIVPIKDIKNQLNEFIIKADQIKFGNEELGPIKQFIDVDTKSQRYSIETQVADLLDELLSTIPNNQRTPRVLNNIHIMIERFKQLRTVFSTFDEYGNVDSFTVKESTYKPLKKWLEKFNTNLYWLLPVVKNVKKIYDKDIEGDSNDFIAINPGTDILEINELFKQYKSNTLPMESNKYNAFCSELNNIFKPFNMIDDEDQFNIISEKEINENINVIIDNLENMYSSVFTRNSIKGRRFVITRYNLSDTRLDTVDSTSSKLITVRIPIDRNEIMSIKSIMTLPEPAIRFSKINLPGTDILSRANLNQIFIGYWEMLKKKTQMSNVFIDSLENEISFNEENFANNIKNYVLNLTPDQTIGMTKSEIYSNFINQFVPKTRIIFNLMKKYINGKLSIVDVVSYFEPFLIYPDDLTFKQYQYITQIIDEKISAYNKNIVEFKKVFNALSGITYIPPISTKAYTIIEIVDQNLRDEILNNGYKIDSNYITTSKDVIYSDSEILKKILNRDCSKLYTSSLALKNVALMYPSDNNNDLEEIASKHAANKSVYDNAIKLENEKITAKLLKAEDNDKCSNIIISKAYTSKTQLLNDNDRVIYFDKVYDKTNYGLMEDTINGYGKQVVNMPVDKLRDHITNDQMKKNNLSLDDAIYLAETLIDGNKKVIDGQYAILYDNTNDKNISFYIRQNNNWVANKSLYSKHGLIDESSIFCDFNPKCINVTTNVGDKCESLDVNELTLQNRLLKNILNEFDDKYKMSQEEFERAINNKLDYFLSIMPLILKMENNSLLKHNNEYFKLGNEVSDELGAEIVSPFIGLLDTILGQADFAKKQNDILRFCEKFTREPVVGSLVNGKEESIHWLYCIKTGIPILPSFKKQLASVYIKSPYQYKNVLEEIKSTIGTISDDGNWWSDKFTGWTICPGEFDVDEGYEDGFKASSRAVMEEDAGNKVIASSGKKAIKYTTPEAIVINNIVNALSIAMGINIENQKEFIINTVIDTIKETVESESVYNEQVKIAAQKGKSKDSYRDFFNKALVFYTFGMYLIAVQTSIPSVKTRKTHSGCIRSFNGYPFEGQGNLSSLTYLACVVNDVKNLTEPWNVLKKMTTDKIQGRIKAVIDDQLLKNESVLRKFEEKAQYLLTTSAEEIPAEHDVALWSDFLPPLVPFKVNHLVNISDEFKRGLRLDLINGSITQREKILVIESKIIKFSLAIQEAIHKIVKNHKAILHTSTGEPYLENSCCSNTVDQSFINYFVNINGNIKEYNKIVTKLNNILDDIKAHTEANIICSKINTKNIYPSISNAFDEKTIYMAFIFYCKFKSLMPVPDDLLTVCNSKPDPGLITSSDSIELIIKKLKEDGRNYTNEQFIRLIELVSRENIIKLNINEVNTIISKVSKLSHFLDAMYNENYEEMLDLSVRDLIKNAIDTDQTVLLEPTKEIKDLNNFLIKSNLDMTKTIIQFVRDNKASSVTESSIRKFANTMTSLNKWELGESNRNNDIKISNDSVYTITNFYKTFIDNFVNIFPNIIKNQVSYNTILINSNYGFSNNHSSKLEKYIGQYFITLREFYLNKYIYKILNEIQNKCKNIVRIANFTPCFSKIDANGKIYNNVIDEDTGRYLFEHYFLLVFMAYIELSDDKSMIYVEKNRFNQDDDEYLHSADYIHETNVRSEYNVNNRDSTIMSGNKLNLKREVAKLLICFSNIFRDEKEIVDTTYEEIQDRVFKLKEREKDMVTDKLKAFTDEKREADTMLKVTKQGIYSKGLQKGLVSYDKDFYEDESELRNEMLKAEKIVRKRKNFNEDDLEILVEEHMVDRRNDEDIERDAYNMEDMNDDYNDGNYEGFELDADDYNNYN
jgi:hypothetical protein